MTSTETTYRLVHRHPRITAPRSKVRGCLGWKGAIGTEHSLKWAGQWVRVDRSPTDNHTSRSPSDIHTINLASYAWTKGAATSESDGFPALPAKQHRTLAICFWRFFGHVPTARLILPLKTAQDARHFLFGAFRSTYP